MAATGKEPVTIEQLRLWQNNMRENGLLNCKTAYDSAVEGGFIGEEAEFNKNLASIGNLNAILDSIIGE